MNLSLLQKLLVGGLGGVIGVLSNTNVLPLDPALANPLMTFLMGLIVPMGGKKKK